MDAQLIAQRDFSAGQLDSAAMRADDTDIMKAGLRTARNVRILATRGLRRRPGRRVLFPTSGICEVVRPASGVEWFMAIEPGSITFRNKALSLRVDFGGMPWNATTIRQLRWVEIGGTIIIAHNSFRPQVFTYDLLTMGWSHAPFAFAADPSGAVRQPYWNFVRGSGVTMLPSGRFGTITVTFSAPILSPGHIWSVFRYADRQLLITGYIDAYTATAAAIEELPPTYVVTMDNVAGLQVGDVIEGVTSGAKGQVAAIAGVAVTVLVTQNWSGFDAAEVVAGPRSKMKVVSQATASPVPTLQWDEPLMSDFRGWPGCVTKDVQRVIFCRFQQFGSAICWSSTGTLNDFRLGAEKEDAIFEYVPENCLVLDVVGGADEFVFTDKGVYYVPVSVSNPLIPGSIDFRLISDDPASPIRPQSTTDGLVFVNNSLTRVFAIIGTGQTARPYVVDDLSEFHSSLIRSPICIATSTADVAAPERYLYACNRDGTLAVAKYQRGKTDRGWVGWVQWDGAGVIEWVAAGSDSVIVTASYETGAGAVRFVEVFEDDLLLDAAQPIATLYGGSPLELTPGDIFELTPGDPLVLDGNLQFNWAVGTRLAVEKNGWYRGTYTIQPDGSLDDEIPAIGVVGLFGGFNFEVEAEPFVHHAEAGKSVKQRLRPRRIKQVGATFQRSQAVEVAGRLVPFYQSGENEEVAPPLRDETYRARVIGRDFDPRWSVKQTLPGALTILELTTEVTI